MKLLSLELLRFGPFTDRCLDFSSLPKGLHIIFGPNEAGKSTALRAVTGLFFGIPERTSDDHIHSPQELRIGASILSESGEALSLRRRKGRKNTLLSPDEQPLPEEALARFFPGLSQELFHNLFGLSHDRLSEGGQDLLRGRGSLGQSLFGAGAGLGSLHRLLSSLEGAADKLFTPKGSKRPLNEAINEFLAWRKKARDTSVRPKEWSQLAAELEELREKLHLADNERKELQQSMDQLQRIRRTKPILNRRLELMSSLEELRDVPLLPQDAAQRRQAAAKTLQDAHKALAKLDEEHERNEQELRELFIPEEVLQHKADIEALAEQAPVLKEDLRTRDTLKHSEDLLQQEVSGLLVEFGLTENDASRIDAFRLSSAAQSRIRRLSNEASGIEAGLRNARSNLEQAQQRLQRLERSLEEQGPSRDIGPLKRAIKRARRHGDLESSLQAAARRREQYEQRIALQLQALMLSKTSYDAVRSLPLPGEKAIARFIEREEAIAARRSELRQKREELEQELLEVEDRLERLQQEERIPSEEELGAARQGRDRLWEEIKQAWLGGLDPQGRGPGEAARELEEAIQSADDISDELRLKARAVAELIQLSTRSDTLKHRIEQQRAKEREAEEQRDSLEAEWREAWAKAGMTPRSPREMADWRARFDQLLESIDAWEQARSEEQQLRQDIEQLQSALLARLQELFPLEISERSSLQEILDEAESAAESISRQESARQSLQEQLEQARLERREQAQLVRDKERASKEWRAKWAEAVSALDLGAEAGPEEASAKLDTLDKLLKKWEELLQTRSRLREIEARQAHFAEEAKRLAARSAPDLEGLPPLEAAAELKRRCDEAAYHESLSQKLRQRQAEIESQRVERRQEAADAKQHLEALRQAAGCRHLEDVPRLEEQSERKRALQQELSTLESSLAQEGLELDALNAEAAAYHPDELQPALTEVSERLEELEADRERLKDRIKEIEQRQRDMEGAGQAAEAEAEAQAALARIDRLVREYARYKMAEVVLQQQMERYRREHQEPILQRAGEIFRSITLGSFHRLLPGFDRNDEMVIMAERPSGQVVAVEGMSDGTRDQLYLSLRLASLEQHLSANEPLPFIADDLLIRFDDERSKAALQILAQTAQATQVLFFTHHAKLLELAKEALPPGSWQQHVLASEPAEPPRA